MTEEEKRQQFRYKATTAISGLFSVLAAASFTLAGISAKIAIDAPKDYKDHPEYIKPGRNQGIAFAAWGTAMGALTTTRAVQSFKMRKKFKSPGSGPQ